MAHYDIVYGKKDLVGVYCDGKLVATHDKHTKDNGDLKRFIDKLLKDGHEVGEQDGEFKTYAEIAAELDKSDDCSCPEPFADPKPEPKPETDTPAPAASGNNVHAQSGTMKGHGTIHRKHK